MSTSGPQVPPGGEVPSATELQRALTSVTGVLGAEVTRGDNGRDRLRISLAPGEDPEAVAWSVAATLRERFGIALDPAAITARMVDGDEDPVRVIRSDIEGGTPSSGGQPPTAPPSPAAPPAPTVPPEPTGTAPPPEPTGTAPPPEPTASPTATASPTPSDRATSRAVPPGPPASEDLVSAARAALAAAGHTDPWPAPVAGAAEPAAADPRPATDDAAAEVPSAPDADEHRHTLRQRAAIRELTAQPDGDDLHVAATLGLSGREATGRARGVRTRRGRWRAIAEATLDALDDLTVGRVRGNVDHVTVLTFADLAHVSVSVTLLTEHGEETFLGAALVRDDPDRAVMRAALDAVNRRVEPWLADAVVAAG